MIYREGRTDNLCVLYQALDGANYCGESCTTEDRVSRAYWHSIMRNAHLGTHSASL